jgi:hypothetical protein
MNVQIARKPSIVTAGVAGWQMAEASLNRWLIRTGPFANCRAWWTT